jgi:hypothetical protein
MLYIHLITFKMEIVHTSGPLLLTVTLANDRPALSSERALRIKQYEMSDTNKDLVLSSRWKLYSKADLLTDRRSYHNF